MRRLIAGLSFAALSMLASAGANALPIAAAGAGESAIILASEGCGPYAHRDRFGRCEPNRPVRRFEERRRYEEPRRFEEPRRREPRCVVRITPFGPRRVCD